jgi:plasmid stabilization system protein ParE
MAEVIWTELALKDLHDLIEYIARDSAVYAERFGVRVVHAPRRL